MNGFGGGGLSGVIMAKQSEKKRYRFDDELINRLWNEKKTASKAHGLSLTQLDFAHAIHKEDRTVRNVLKGEWVTEATARLVARYLDYPLNELLAPSERVRELLECDTGDWSEQDWASPGAMLRAEYDVVPLHMRDAELKNLKKWCDKSDVRHAVRLYTAPGGMGKTRLARALCHSFDGQGNWEAGFFGRPRAQDGERPWQLLAQHDGPVLLVIDYVETRRDELLAVLEAALSNEHPRWKLRLILLARAADDWWLQLKSEPGPVGELLSGGYTRHERLKPLAMDRQQRQESFEIAASAFANLMGKTAPEPVTVDFDDSCYERVLLLHMAALARVEDTQVQGEQGVLDYMMARERGFWRDLIRLYQLEESWELAIPEIMLCVTLGGGVVSKSEALELLRKVPTLSGVSGHVLDRIARVLHTTYPGLNYIEPLMPDLLGEHLAQQELDRGNDVNEWCFELLFGPRS